jgi:hypothetical protein
MSRCARPQAMSGTARGASMGRTTSSTPKAALRHGVHAGNGISDADVDSPDGSLITIKLVCGNGVVLTVTDPATVEAMLLVEVARRREAREVAP